MAEGGDIMNILQGLFNNTDDVNSSDTNSDDEEFMSRDLHHMVQEPQYQDDNIPWIYSPRSLQSWSAVQIVKQDSPVLIQRGLVPHALYETLLLEAIRVKTPNYLEALISHWPYEVLNLQNIELPDWPRHMKQKVGPNGLMCVDIIVKGLLTLQTQSLLSIVHMPEFPYKGSLMTKKILQLPLFSLPNLSFDTVKDYMEEHILKSPDFEKYLLMVSLPNYESSNKRAVEIHSNLHLEGLSEQSNSGDVLLGLAMQRHSNYTFIFNQVHVNNCSDINILSKIIGLMHDPQGVKSVKFSCDGNTDGLHVFYKLTCLLNVLKKFKNIEEFRTDFRGLYVMSLQPHLNNQMALLQTSLLFNEWLHLQVLDISGNQITGHLGHLVACLQTPLRELHLAACMLNSGDVDSLAESIHVLQLEVLNFDNNRLDEMTDSTICLLSHLGCIVKLSLAGCNLSVNSGLRLVKALSGSTTLKSLDISRNSFHTLNELRELLLACRQCKSVREVLCKPYELHTIFAGLYIQTGEPRNRLSSSEESSLHDLAKQLHLHIY